MFLCDEDLSSLRFLHVSEEIYTETLRKGVFIKTVKSSQKDRHRLNMFIIRWNRSYTIDYILVGYRGKSYLLTFFKYLSKTNSDSLSGSLKKLANI